MLNRFERSGTRRRFALPQCGLQVLRSVLCWTAAAAILIVLLQSACFFKKGKIPVLTSSSPVRIVFLPFNTPAGNKDLRWTAMAMPVIAAKISEHAPGLDPVPLWEAMPVAKEAAGNSRTFTQESAAYVASWLTAKWSAMGEVTPAKNGITLLVDFIPAKSNLIPFRYLKTGTLDSSGPNIRTSLEQFLRYLVAKPLDERSEKPPSITALKSLAEALDREYGWSVDAEPGKAQDIVSRLARTDGRLARFLFSPILYSVLAQTK